MSGSVNSTCPYCGVGCGVTVTVPNGGRSKGGRSKGGNAGGGHDKGDLIAVSGDTSHPANAGRLCVKGSNLADTMTDATRLKVPQIAGKEVSWQQAIDHVALGFSDTVAEHGPDSVAFYLSGQMLTEDYYVANKLLKGFVGTANVDTNSRLCMASAVVAQKRAFGEDVVPCDYDDLRSCKVLVLVGSNAAWAHPVLFQIAQARRHTGDLKIVVIDPRATATAREADLHLAIAPGSDLALFTGLLAHLDHVGALDQTFIHAHTNGFDQALACATQAFSDQADVAKVCDVDAKDLDAFYRLFTQTEHVVTLYSQGINQSARGVDQGNAIINCHLATGRIGRPGMGPFSITGQPNAMGGREVGGMANTLAAHMDFDAQSIDRVRRFWQAPAMAREPGLKAVDMFDAVASGRIKAIWIMATNPVASLPDKDFIAQALAQCPLVVVSDCYGDTDTVQLADVRLPAQGWGEKDGTVTNSERCISRQRRVVTPDFDARPDWKIVCDVAKAMGFTRGFDYSSPSQIFAEHAALSVFENTGERLFALPDHVGLSDEAYDGLNPVSWPMNGRPFADRRFSTPDGRANFVVTPPALTSAVSHRFPLLLNTGRLRDQWHTMSRTGLAVTLNQHAPEPRLDINPQDAEALGIVEDQLVSVLGPTGSARYLAHVTESVKVGQVFAPIHWTKAHAGQSVVSGLVPRRVDPLSGQPHSKQVAVAVQPIKDCVWLRGVLFDSAQITALRDTLGQESLFWFGLSGKGGWFFEVASDGIEASRVFSSLVQCLDGDDWVDFRTPSLHRRSMSKGQQLVLVLCQAPGRHLLPTHSQIVASSTPSQSSQDELPSAPWRQLACSAQSIDTSAQICSCYAVSEARIRKSINEGCQTLTALGEVLKCGTNCGSCVPELNRLLQISEPAAVTLKAGLPVGGIG